MPREAESHHDSWRNVEDSRRWINGLTGRDSISLRSSCRMSKHGITPCFAIWPDDQVVGGASGSTTMSEPSMVPWGSQTKS